MDIIVRLTIDAMKAGQGKESYAKSFAKGVISIGRNAENDVILNDPRISGIHSRLIVRPNDKNENVLHVLDCGSSNGTFVEDVRVPSGLEVPVQPGNRIVIGSFVIVAQIEVMQVSRSSVSQRNRSNTEAAHAQLQAQLDRAPFDRSAYEEERRIKRTIHEHLIHRLDLRRQDISALSESDLRQRARTVVEAIIVDLRWEMPQGLDREALIEKVLDEALGLGPLEDLLSDDSCSEIMVNRYDQIYAEIKGKLQLTDLRFSGEQAVLNAIERILAPIGRRIDESSPLVDARLKDGSRVNAVIRPLALKGPCITIRKFSKVPLVVDDLIDYGSLSEGMAGFLKLAVETRQNIVISGGTGSGKTTLLNVISAFIPNDQRLVTVEDAAELRLPQEHVVSFETRPPNLEGKGAIAIRDLVRNALRMRPDRIIVGECRGSEALDMLQAMNTGHDGSMTTGHANTPDDMVRRLETMVLMAGLDLPVRAIREQIASSVDIIVQQTRFCDGSRRITAISEVAGMDYDTGCVVLEPVFVFLEQGYDTKGKLRGVHQATGYIPQFFRQLQAEGKPVDASVFSPD